MTRLPFLLILVIGFCCPLLAAETEATGIAQLTKIPSEYHFDGIVEATQQSTISAQTQGQVIEILADVDDFVEQGAVIIRLRDTEQQARLEQAKAELKAANAQLQEAGKEFERTREIFARKLVAQAAMDKATASLKSAKARQEATSAA
ncbi:MAG: biotin/lipoyl-binding protein, partial [Sedimenticola sp.]|nr:biotin/lipoyl-binding protein [Sedimenticola sp.]